VRGEGVSLFLRNCGLNSMYAIDRGLADRKDPSPYVASVVEFCPAVGCLQASCSSVLAVLVSTTRARRPWRAQRWATALLRGLDTNPKGILTAFIPKRVYLYRGSSCGSTVITHSAGACRLFFSGDACKHKFRSLVRTNSSARDRGRTPPRESSVESAIR